MTSAEADAMAAPPPSSHTGPGLEPPLAMENLGIRRQDLEEAWRLAERLRHGGPPAGRRRPAALVVTLGPALLAIALLALLVVAVLG